MQMHREKLPGQPLVVPEGFHHPEHSCPFDVSHGNSPLSLYFGGFWKGLEGKGCVDNCVNLSHFTGPLRGASHRSSGAPFTVRS